MSEDAMAAIRAEAQETANRLSVKEAVLKEKELVYENKRDTRKTLKELKERCALQNHDQKYGIPNELLCPMNIQCALARKRKADKAREAVAG